MISLIMIEKYLNEKENAVKLVLGRTRSSTRDLKIKNREKLNANFESKDAFYNLNGQEHIIKFLPDGKITDVSCGKKCFDFCEHRRSLLIKIKKDLKSPLPENNRKRKLDDENNSDLINSDQKIAEIKLVKKKKIFELSHELLDSVQVIKMENLIKSFGRGNFKDFIEYCKRMMNDNSHLMNTVNVLTVDQADTSIWHELRIGRITASRLYETTRCTMTKGSLVDKFLGKKSGWSFAMMRGTVLEEFVFEEIKKEFAGLQRAGLIMNQNVHPFFAASPDGLHEDFVLEIKCPNTPNTFQQYINVDTLSKKYFAQIQLQMLITGKTKALLAVASLDFEKTRNITKVWIPLDECYINEMIIDATEFYEKAIFPALKKKYLK